MLDIHSEGKRAEERKFHAQQLAMIAGDTWSFLTHVTADANTSLQTGTLSVSPDTEEIATLAGYNSDSIINFFQARVIEDKGRIVPNPYTTTVSLYADFFEAFTDSKDLEEKVTEGIIRNPIQQHLFDYLFAVNPIVGATTVVLYDTLKREQQEAKGSKHWYVESTDSATRTMEIIYSFFEIYKDKLPEKDELTRNFLEDFKQETLLSIADMLNIANCMQLHIQESGCGVLSAGVPFGKNKSLVADVNSLKQNAYDNRESIFTQLSKPIFDFNARSNQETAIPVFLSPVDIPRYADFMQMFWMRLYSGLLSDKHQRKNAHGALFISLANKTNILFRDRQNEDGQARISLMTGKYTDSFSIRVDKDRNGVAMDIGGANADDVLAVAYDIKQKETIQPIAVQCSDMIDNKGLFKRNLNNIATIMLSEAQSPVNPKRQISGERKAAIFASLAMHQSANIGLRGWDFHRHHSRQHINKLEYVQNFDRIVRKLAHVL